MSERGGGGGGNPSGGPAIAPANRDPRRASFRRTLAEAASLPPDFLDSLEQKRKQLDESIHKYIASKEREYKNFERDLRQQHRLAQAHAQEPINGVDDVDQDGVEGVDRRRIPPEATQTSRAEVLDAEDEVRIHDLKSEIRNNHTIVEPPGVGRSIDEDGVHGPGWERTLSAPGALEIMAGEGAEVVVTAELARGNSDTSTQLKPKHPPHIQLSGRISSPGSLADGRLTSAMKSPTQRPKGKRVSLQVGGAIVTPSEPVPQALSHYSSSSHSRNRSPGADRQRPSLGKEATNLLRNEEKPPASPIYEEQAGTAGLTVANGESNQKKAHNIAALRSSPRISAAPIPQPSRIDADGDLFDLEAEESDPPSPLSISDDVDGIIESDGEISGRVRQPSSASTAVAEPDNVRPDGPLYDPEAGLVLPDAGATVQLDYSASQQPAQAGFRRPSVVRDPIYSGSGSKYAEMEHDAEEQAIYSSSFLPHGNNKGSFTAGSLGESFMEKNAEEMIRLRNAARQL